MTEEATTEMLCTVPVGKLGMFAAVSCLRCQDTETIPATSWDNVKNRLKERGWRLHFSGNWICPDCIETLIRAKADKLIAAQQKAEKEKKREAKRIQPLALKPEEMKRGSMLCPRCHNAAREYQGYRFFCVDCKHWFAA